MSEAIVPAGVSDWAKQHVADYLATDGAVGHMFVPPTHDTPMPTLLLTTVGRGSGQKYIVPLVYGEDSGNYIVVGSRGGAPNHPGWYMNIEKTPEIDIQVLGDRFEGRARIAQGEERDRLWKVMTTVNPHYDDYQAKTDRKIPIIVLERI